MTAELLPLNTNGIHSKSPLTLPRSKAPWNRLAVGTVCCFFSFKCTNKSFHHCLHPSQGFPTIQRPPFEFDKSMQWLKTLTIGDKKPTNKKPRCDSDLIYVAEKSYLSDQTKPEPNLVFGNASWGCTYLREIILWKLLFLQHGRAF